MTLEDTDQLIAKERANRYAPDPKYRPTEVGSMCAFSAVLVIILFTSFTGIDRQQSALTEAIVVLVSFALPFWYVWTQRQKHIKAVDQELSTIEEAKGGRR